MNLSILQIHVLHNMKLNIKLNSWLVLAPLYINININHNKTRNKYVARVSP